MAIQGTSVFELPRFVARGSGASASTIALDANGELAAIVCQVPKTGTIASVRFHVSTVTASGDFDVRLETVDDTTGQPTGTLIATDTNLVHTVSAGGQQVATLTAAASVTCGNLFAIVVKSVGTGNIALTQTNAMANTFPYGVTYLASTWAKWGTMFWVTLVYSSPTDYQFPLGAWSSRGLTELITGLDYTPDEIGNVFTLPVGVRTIGALVHGDSDHDAELRLLSSNDTELAVAVHDPQVRNNTSYGILLFPWPASVTLAADTTYRLVWTPSTATLGNVLYTPYSSNEELTKGHGKGLFYKTSRVNGGSWTDDNTMLLLMALVCDGMDLGSSGTSRSRVIGRR